MLGTISTSDTIRVCCWSISINTVLAFWPMSVVGPTCYVVQLLTSCFNRYAVPEVFFAYICIFMSVKATANILITGIIVPIETVTVNNVYIFLFTPYYISY